MRRSVLKALATVSLATLVTVATSSQAVTPASLGALKQLDKWKVGIVDPEGQSFCAMVNKFDKNVGLAFALSPDGYGSVAVDVANEMFTPGEGYNVSLKTNGATVGSFQGKATSPRSVVVQVGQNAKLYDALKSNAKLGVGLPVLDAEFTLNKFAASYRQLIDCAHTLPVGVNGKDGKMPAVKVKDVEKSALDPLDRELADLSGQKAPVTEKAANDKAAAFDDAEEAVATEGTKVAAAAMPAEIGAQKPKTNAADIAWNDAQKDLPVQRKLLATAKTPSITPPAGDTGATAKLWDEKQGGQRQQAEVVALAEQSRAADDARVALVNAVKTETKQLPPAQTLTVENKVQVTQPVTLAKAPENKALKATLVAKQAEAAAAKSESEALKKQLSDAKSEAETSKARAQQLQSQLATAQNQKTHSDAERMEHLQSQLSRSEEEKRQLETSLNAVDKQTKLLSATLSQKQKELETTSKGAKELEAVKVEIARLQAENAASVASLQKQLEQQKGQYADLQGEYARLQKHNAAVAATANAEIAKQQQALNAQLARQDAYVSELEQKVAKAENERALAEKHTESVAASTTAELTKQQQALNAQLAAQRAYAAELEQKVAKVEAERTQAQKDARTARKSLIIINDDELPVSLTKKEPPAPVVKEVVKQVEVVKEVVKPDPKTESELSAARSQLSQLEQQLEMSRQQVAELQKSTAQNTAKSPVEQEQALNDQRSKLDAAQSEIARLREKNAELAGSIFNQQAAGIDTTAQTKVLEGQKAQLASAQAQIERLKGENQSLSGKLSKGETEAVPPAPVVAGTVVAEPSIPAPVETAPVVAGVEREELSSARTRIATLENELREKRDHEMTQKALPAPIAPVSYADRQVAFAPSAPLPTRKPVQHAKQQPSDIDVTDEILAVEPAAGERMEPVVSASLPPKLIEHAGAIRPAQAPVMQASAEDQPFVSPLPKRPAYLQRVVPATQQPVTAAAVLRPITGAVAPAPVAAASAPKDPGFDHNRAAAFLDRIMASHRGGKVAPADDDAAPVFGVHHDAPAAARFTNIETAAGAEAPVAAPVARVAQKSQIPTGYSGVKKQAPVAAPVQEDMSGDAFPAPVMATPIRAPEPALAPAERFSPAPAAAPAPVTPAAPVEKRAAAQAPAGIEQLLAAAGVSDASFKPAEHEGDVTVRQWTTGGISGMYEQLPAHGKLSANASQYIERYREDCSTLQVRMGAARQTAQGAVQQADIACPVEGNTYATSFVFWQDASHFNAVLHSGYPADGSRVQDLADGIASALGGAGGMSPETAVQKADAIVAPAADRPQLRFNLPQQSSATYTGGSTYATRPQGGAPHDFETVVIE